MFMKNNKCCKQSRMMGPCSKEITKLENKFRSFKTKKVTV